MKILKLLFSKILIVALLFLAQAALIYTAIAVLEIFPLFQLISVIVSLAVLLTIINKKEPPEFKIPWLVLLMLFPFFTIVTYLLFANAKMSKRDCRRLRNIEINTRKHTDIYLNGASENVDGGIADYIENTAHMPAHTGSRVTYYKLGELFWEDLKKELEKAQKYIFMEYFIVHDGQMWDAVHEILKRKAQEGVEVRFMYDDIGSVGAVGAGFCRKLKKEGINCRKFNPFRPVVSGVHNNRDHRKITVIDGKVGFTGGVNLGDEYINRNDRLGHWKDTALKIEGSAVDNLLSLFLQLFDTNAKTADEDIDKYYVELHEDFGECGVVIPFGDGPKPFYTEQIGENNYINLINSAKRYCYITTPYLIPDYSLITALKNAALRGVDVRIITPHIPDKKMVFNMTRSNYPHLLKSGVKIYEYTPGFIHAKMLVADDDRAFVGTINLDYRSLVHHYECGAVLYGAPCIADIKEDIDYTLLVSQEVPKDFRLGRITALFNAVLNIFSTML